MLWGYMHYSHQNTLEIHWESWYDPTSILARFPTSEIIKNQRISLGLCANSSGLEEAEKTAQLIDFQLQHNKDKKILFNEKRVDVDLF